MSDNIFDTFVIGDGVVTIPVPNSEPQQKEVKIMPESTPTRAYGPVEQTDDTRQAQHQVANDTPVDVNFNAITARSQSLTIDALGKGFAAAQERRQIMADKEINKP